MKQPKDILQAANFRRLHERHAELQRLQAAVDAALGRYDIAAGRCRVESFADAALVLRAESPAVCACIRQILPTLRETLKINGFATGAISVIGAGGRQS